MPELDALKADLAGDNIDVLAVSSDRAGHTAISEFYEKTGIKNLDALHDPKNVAGRALGVRGLPTTLIINPDGKEVARIVGIHKYDTEESKAYFKRCIGTLP
ncbi:TlpA family protein disulfide reductase, partial [Rhodospirillales bacterium]|nr:TlpA family protein disulfide reductase [Rhodospirillales bacterium]